MTINAFLIPGLMTPEEIAADIWGTTVEALQLKSRKREIVECRQTLLYYLKTKNDEKDCNRKSHSIRKNSLSASSIGALYGKDHASVYDACKTVSALRETNKEYRKKYELFLEKIN